MTDNQAVIVAVAFCPQPPLLHPEVLGSAGQEMGATLRLGCADAVDRMLAARPDAVLVLGAAATSSSGASERVAAIGSSSSDAMADTAAYGPGDAGDLMGYGVAVRLGFDGPPKDGGARLPLPHTLGAWLLDEAGFTGQRLGLRAGEPSVELRSAIGGDRRWAMLVMGDGSARRSEKSPGWYDPDAIPFDDAVAAALESGDGRALLDLDQTVGERVMAAGLTSWNDAGAILRHTRMDGQLHYTDAPFGVFYVAASWLRQR